MKENNFVEIRAFVIKLISGHILNSAEDLQFYMNNRVEIEKLLIIYGENTHGTSSKLDLDD